MVQHLLISADRLSAIRPATKDDKTLTVYTPLILVWKDAFGGLQCVSVFQIADLCTKYLKF